MAWDIVQLVSTVSLVIVVFGLKNELKKADKLIDELRWKVKILQERDK